MFKFIAKTVVVLVLIVIIQTPVILAKPGDFTDAAETVDVPPEHRAAPPAPPQQNPVQPPYQPRAIFPAAAIPGGPQYPLFFTTQNGFVPFGSIYNAYQQPAAVAPVILPQDQAIVAPIVTAVL